MNTSDFCRDCGASKVVRVIFTDGGHLEVWPGGVAPADPNIVFQIETCCSECGLMYSMGSLLHPVELYR